MKKLILSVAAIGAMALPAFSQGISFADNSPNAVDNTIGGVANNTQDLNLELLLGASASTVTTPVVTLLLSSGSTYLSSTTPQNLGQISGASGDISFFGTIDDQSGAEFNLSAYAGDTLDFQVLAWTGNYSTYAAALDSGAAGVYAGASQIFSDTVPTSLNANPIDVSGVGVINLTQVVSTPEPSTLAMAGVGLASMLIFRRKNK